MKSEEFYLSDGGMTDEKMCIRDRLTAVTGKDGSFSFENIPYGHWIVKEISAPDL